MYAIRSALLAVLLLLCQQPSLADFTWNDDPFAVWATNCDFQNSDIGSSKIVANRCSRVCHTHPTCTHFAWTTYNGGTCWLKSKTGVITSEANASSLPNSRCGILKAPEGPQPSSRVRVPLSVAQSQPDWTLFSRNKKIVTRTAWFSEEGNGFSGRQTAPIAGIVCEGDFCDNKRLVVVRDGSVAPVLDTTHWTRWISDDDPSWANCPHDMIVNEMQCSKDYCDNIRMQCGRLSSGYRMDIGDLKQVDWFSEEAGERLCPDGYYFWGMACRDRFCDGLKLNCVRVDYIPQNVVQRALPYAPVYYFDGDAENYCFPDWPSTSNNNVCRSSFLDSTPIFVEHNVCGTDDVYTFWIWYGWQKGCIIGDSGHDNDWEHVSVYVRDGQVQKVMYFQHKGQYTRKRDTFGRSGERSHVYIGKVGHGSYHAECDGVCGLSEFFGQGCLGSVNYCQGGCFYWDDFRNPGPRLDAYTVHDLRPGQTIDGIGRPDRAICVSACEGSNLRLPTTSGCWQNNV